MAMSTSTIAGMFGNYPDMSRCQSKVHKNEADKVGHQGSTALGGNAQSKVQPKMPRTEEEYREIIFVRTENRT